jgi:hypothetical protein
MSGRDAVHSKVVGRSPLSPDFSALVAGTLNSWFLDRTLSKRGL